MKLLALLCLCVALLSVAGCKPDAAVKRGAVIDSAPSRQDNGKAGTAAPQQQNQTPPPAKVQ